MRRLSIRSFGGRVIPSDPRPGMVPAQPRAGSPDLNLKSKIATGRGERTAKERWTGLTSMSSREATSTSSLPATPPPSPSADVTTADDGSTWEDLKRDNDRARAGVRWR